MTDEIYEKYRKQFEERGHIATPVLINKDFWIVDWHRASGSSDYAVRYIIDCKKGNLIITGDLGDCVASWYTEVTPANMQSYVQSIDYFIGKMQATSNKYRYDWEDIESDLDAIKQEYLKNLDDYDLYPDLADDERRIQIDDDFEELVSILEDISVNEHTSFPREYVDIVEKYNTDWWESDFISVGKRIDPRVYLWAVGLREAYRAITR